MKSVILFLIMATVVAIEDESEQFIENGMPCYMNDTCIDPRAKCC